MENYGFLLKINRLNYNSPFIIAYFIVLLTPDETALR